MFEHRQETYYLKTLVFKWQVAMPQVGGIFPTLYYPPPASESLDSKK